MQCQLSHCQGRECPSCSLRVTEILHLDTEREKAFLDGGGRGPPRGRSHAGGLGGLKEGHLPSQVHTRMSRVPAVALAGLPPEGAPAPSAPTPGAARPWAINAVTQQIDATISSQLPLGLIFYRLGDQSPHT